MLEACLSPELSSEIHLQPVRRHDVDAAISSATSSCRCGWRGSTWTSCPASGRCSGRRCAPPTTSARLAGAGPLTPEALAPITAGVELAVKSSTGTPLLGFAGAPFTSPPTSSRAAPSRDHLAARTLMHADPNTWFALTEWAADLTGAFLRAQVLAGASAVQLFDSWAGSLSRRRLRGPGRPREHPRPGAHRRARGPGRALRQPAPSNSAHRDARRPGPTSSGSTTGPPRRREPPARRGDAAAGNVDPRCSRRRGPCSRRTCATSSGGARTRRPTC